MSIKSRAEFEKLRAIGKIARAALDAMAENVRAGITTAELDAIGADQLARYGAESAPPKTYGFPKAVCISVNDEAIHGIPKNRVLQAGDLVKLDLVAEKDGFFADSALTVRVGDVSPMADALVRCAENAFWQATKAARAGNRSRDIGGAVEHEVRRCGFSVMKELCGHGVGRAIHEEPSIPNFRDPRSRTRLTEGLVITIEPIIAAGNGKAELMNDRWTVASADRSLTAHYEHTIVITNSNPIVLTS